jgi:trehalose synthase
MAVPRGSLDAHEPACGREAIERIRSAAKQLEGARVVHVSAASAGGRVPELLKAMLPLVAELGIGVKWHVLFGDAELQSVGRSLHDGLQGAETVLRDDAFGSYLDACASAARGLPDADLVVLHDAPTLGLAAALEGRSVWHCHVDSSEPDRVALDRAEPLTSRCEGLAFPAESFAPPELRPRARALPPGIDPLDPRNLELASRLAGRVVRPLGVDLSRPFVCQVMRFDRWKDPHAAIEAFMLARGELPELQLVLAGALDDADPGGWSVLREISDYADGNEDVLLLTSYEGVGGLELGALQFLARAAIQRSIREGFGLAASEAMWKGTPVIGGTEGGLPLQVRDGVDGYLTDDVGEAAERIVEVVRDPGLAIELGESGRERVRDRFLVTRVLEDSLGLVATLLGATVQSQ